jgi:hypothetical protein
MFFCNMALGAVGKSERIRLSSKLVALGAVGKNKRIRLSSKLVTNLGRLGK